MYAKIREDMFPLRRYWTGINLIRIGSCWYIFAVQVLKYYKHVAMNVNLSSMPISYISETVALNPPSVCNSINMILSGYKKVQQPRRIYWTCKRHFTMFTHLRWLMVKLQTMSDLFIKLLQLEISKRQKPSSKTRHDLNIVKLHMWAML